VDREKATEWLKKGALPTDSAKALLARAGVPVAGQFASGEAKAI
ncbi:MAG: 30S ribosomal protein S16, partial [Bacillota bacterium]|nr:30S ribosomal protein S16 [Bacillota bacterium]